MHFLKIVNIALSLILVKYEIETKDKTILKSLIDSTLQSLRENTVSSLSLNLKKDVYIIVQPNTKGYFKEYVSKYPKNYDFYLIFRIRNTLKVTPTNISMNLDKNKTYFLIDKDTLKYYKEFEEKDIDYIFYTGQLVEKNDFVKEKIFTLYKNIEDCYFSLYNTKFIGIPRKKINYNLDDVDVMMDLNNSYKEIRLNYRSMGTIHKVEYYSRNDLCEELKDHFIRFYNSCSNEKHFRISEKYIDEVYEILYKKGILYNKLTHSEKVGLIELLFPFRFCESIVQNFHQSFFVTGGICFDQVESNVFFKNLFNLKVIKEFGKRFIFTGIIKGKGNKVYVEMI